MKYDALIDKLSKEVKDLKKELQKVKTKCTDLEDELFEMKINEVPIYPVFLEEADFNNDDMRWVS